MKPGTVDCELATVSGILGSAVQWGYVEKRPRIPFLKPDNGRSLSLTPEQRERLLTFFRDTPSYRPYHPALRLFLITGARRTELLSLKWEDCQDGQLTFGETKGGRPRSLPITPEIAEVLEDLPKKGPYIFRSPLCKGRPLEGNTFSVRLKQAVRALGLPEETCIHTLRHTAATRMLVEQKIDPRTVMEILGHKSMVMLQRYTHAWNDAMREALSGSEHPPQGSAPALPTAGVTLLSSSDLQRLTEGLADEISRRLERRVTVTEAAPPEPPNKDSEASGDEWKH